MQNHLYYWATVLIWGSTWLAIRFQLGVVDPRLSIAYRFAIAGGLLWAYCRVRGFNLRFPLAVHGAMALQGLFLFALNYWFIYQAEARISSGLVALIFCTMVIMNTLNGALFLGTPIRREVVWGGLVGLSGILLVFWPEVAGFSWQSAALGGLTLALVGTLSASLGNIVSARNQGRAIPLLQTNAYGMLYGALLMALLAWVADVPWQFDWRPAYVASLLYLATFGSILAFGFYLALVGRIGADRAAYVTLLFPLVALALSTLFEGYQWGWQSLLGVVLVLVGNLLAMSRRHERLVATQEAAL